MRVPILQKATNERRLTRFFHEGDLFGRPVAESASGLCAQVATGDGVRQLAGRRDASRQIRKKIPGDRQKDVEPAKVRRLERPRVAETTPQAVPDRFVDVLKNYI